MRVCVCYMLCSHERLHLERSLSVMQYSWINDIVILYTNMVSIPYIYNNIHVYYEDHGFGLDEAPESHGFHQLNARNSLLEHARQTNCDWLLLVDPDEYFIEDTISEIEKANTQSCDSISFETYNPINLQQIFILPEHLVKTRINPTVRAIKSQTNYQYDIDPHLKITDQMKNWTRHPALQYNPLTHYESVGPYHVHTRFISEKKHKFYESIAGCQYQNFNFILPQIYVDVWNGLQCE